jgi:hypothetical protein
MPEPVKKDFHSVARFLRTFPRSLYSKLQWMYACEVAKQISYPIPLERFAELCRVRESTLIKWARKKSPPRNWSKLTELDEADVEFLLFMFQRVWWIFDTNREVPSEFLPSVDVLISERKQALGQKHIADANQLQEIKQGIYLKYKDLELKELGTVFNNGNNDLDELEFDVIKTLINQKLRK